MRNKKLNLDNISLKLKALRGHENRHSKKIIKILKTETNKENHRFGKNGFDHRNLQVSKYVKR